MKALVLMGSPRPNGAVAGLMRCFTELWERRGYTAEVIEAYQAAVAPCIHCGYCKQVPSCRYDDGFTPIDRALREADALVIASPVYGLGFPAPLKAVFDRTQQYFEAKFSLGSKQPIPKHKPGLLLAAYGSPNPRGLELMEEQLRLVFLLVNASLRHTIAAPNTDQVPVNPEIIRTEIDRAIDHLV